MGTRETDRIHETAKKMAVLKAMANLLDWDMQTGAPPESSGQSTKYGQLLLIQQRDLVVTKEMQKLLGGLNEEMRISNPVEYAEGKELQRMYDSLSAVSGKEYRKYTEAGAGALRVWAKARKKDSFADFEKVLTQIVDSKKKIAEARAEDKKKPYDVLLADFEESFDAGQLDIFFEKIKGAVLPLIRELEEETGAEEEKQEKILYSKEKQKELCRFLSEYIGFDFTRGLTGESEHPFTTSLHNQDVRWTNLYQEEDPLNAVFSGLHESGHGIYEQNIAAELSGSILGTAASAAMHEAQARLFENFIGREEAFWEPVYPKLQDILGGKYADMTLKAFCASLRKAKPGAVRMAADELTYPLHIIIRYELEKALFEGELEVTELPSAWKQKYEEYLGVTPKDDVQGVLQDIHWASGEFGYFPSYNIGNAIAAQMYAHMKNVLPLDKYLREGNLKAIVAYLTAHVYRFGMLKNTEEILMDMTGEALNADYYIQYLREHYAQRAK